MERLLDRTELIEVIADRIKPGRSLLYEYGDPYVAILDENDHPLLWSNGMRKIMFRVESPVDFASLCTEISHRCRLPFNRREQPKNLTYIPSEQIYRFGL